MHTVVMHGDKKSKKNSTYKRRKCYSSCTRARVVFWRFRSPAVVNKKIDPYGASRGWAPGISKKYYIKIQIFIILMPGRSSRGQFLHTVHVWCEIHKSWEILPRFRENSKIFSKNPRLASQIETGQKTPPPSAFPKLNFSWFPYGDFSFFIIFPLWFLLLLFLILYMFS